MQKIVGGNGLKMNEGLRKKLQKLLEDSLFYDDLPGIALEMACGQTKFDFSDARGYKDYPEKEPLSTDHVFHMCSLSKLFTGTAILRLWEQKQLSLDMKVAEILPWVSIDDTRFKEITLWQMMSHTSGFPDLSGYGWDQPRLDANALRDYACSEEVTNAKLLWNPSECRFSYSNMAYEILGCVIGEAAQMSFEEYVQKSIFDPLGMENSGFLTFTRTQQVGIEGNVEDPAYGKESLSLENLSRAGMAMPHGKNEQKQIVKLPCYPYNREHGPSSTLTSTLADIGKWARAHLRPGTLLHPNTYDLVWREYATVPNNGEKIGLSWFMREQNGYTLYGHEGTDDGFRSSFWICPKLQAYIVTVANASKAPTKKVSKAAFDLLVANVR